MAREACADSRCRLHHQGSVSLKLAGMKVLSSPQQFHVKMDGFAYAFLKVGWSAEGDLAKSAGIVREGNHGLGND